MERRYSLFEIDRMRFVLRQGERNAGEAEDQLRTYMLNGTSPDELEEKLARGWGITVTAVRTMDDYPKQFAHA